ncbi:MAG: FeoC-like transcriptional regulator [Calothrix sp. MO_167.B42]|nr:FeoC-like transcriptional regulator [Calothrix sp. MO_167.B42]
MILRELQEFILNYHRVSLREMELHFRMDGDALRQMLNKLIKKGRVRKLPASHKCHGCTSCNPDTNEFYEWVEQNYPDSFHLPEDTASSIQ